MELLATVKTIPRVIENPRQTVRKMAGVEVTLHDPQILHKQKIFTVLAVPTNPEIQRDRISVDFIDLSPEAMKLLEKEAKIQ